ncbi:MAG: O-antigen ligase family protein [Nitrospiraceae bacterium]|nr:O-antigen ligase family protein [Nitrospiraceae bacterium]
MFRKLSRVWLAGILLFVPFQMMLAERTVWGFNYLYQITIVLFFPIAIGRLYRERGLFRGSLVFFSVPLLAVAVSGAISGLINRNPLFVTTLGIFDYVKNFLVIFIYAAFFTEADEWQKILNYLLVIGAALGAVAFLQEIWALNFHYLFDYNIYHTDNYILRSLPAESWKMMDFWRLGIYRASSLMDHPDALGLYCLLLLFIYLSARKEINPLLFFLLYTGVFVGVSRMVYAGFMLLAGVQFFRGRRWIAAFSVPIIVLMFFMSGLPDLDVSHLLKGDIREGGIKIFQVLHTGVKKKEINAEEITNEEEEAKLGAWDFREYARDKAMKIWSDSPVLGAGPGMFGGVISVMFNSPVYKKYGFSQQWYDYMKPFRSLDQFWPQALAELGAEGTLVFAGFLLSILVCLSFLGKRSRQADARGLFAGLAGACLLIFVYTMGSGLNEASFLFTYCAFVGMALGYENAAIGWDKP